MSTAKHTPGPWFLCVENGDKRAFYVFAESQFKNERIEISVWDDFIARAGLNHENFEANAQLIAAAPDLLAALQGFINHGTCFDEQDMKAACAAIAKATGAAA